MIPVFVAAAVVLVAFGGLLAAADAALTVLSRTDLVELAASSRSRKSLLAIAGDPAPHLNALNFARVVSETSAAVLVTLALSSAFVEQWWWTLIIAALIMTGVSFVLVGSSPRSVGRANARPIIRFAAPIVRALRVLLGPIPAGLVWLGNRVTPGRRAASFSSEEQLLSMVDEATELDVLEEEDRELIHSIFEFNETVVREVMVPRTDMITIDGDAAAEVAMERFLSTGVSRMPVIGEDIDEVLGVLYLKDLTRVLHEGARKAGDAASLARRAFFAPESQKADDLLREMQRQSIHLAMVVDEYGGIAGLVTLEDLIEELVGEISDEYDRETPDAEALPGGRYRVAARMAIDELGDLFGLELEDDEVDSVGGLLTKVLGRLPVVGDQVHYSGLSLTAERAEGRRKRISTVEVERDE